MNRAGLTKWIKNRAAEIGFSACGIARADFLKNDAIRLESWLKAGYHGSMTYMENHFDMRVDPRKLMEGARSVIVLLYNYFPEKPLPESDNFILSKYAYGEDYHHVIKDKLYQLIGEISELTGEIHARPFVDTAPVLERAWAERAGLGWVGKNANFIIPKKGSFFFISEIITDLELDYDQPRNNDFCGDCTRCLDACPTQAIVAPRVVDARRCISYLTIELKSEIPDKFEGKFQDRMFGCDICQDVCPWTKFSVSHSEQRFVPNPKLETMKTADWEELTPELFNELFRKSAVKRTKYAGLIRNIRFVSNGKGT